MALPLKICKIVLDTGMKQQRRHFTYNNRFLFSGRGFQRLATTTALCFHISVTAPLSSIMTAMAFSTSSNTATAAGNNDSCNDENSWLVQALLNGGDNDNWSPPPPPPPHPHMIIHHITERIGSTQDEARRILAERETTASDNHHPDGKFFAVIADQQTAGRGTNGRTWESAGNNLYLTVAVPLSRIPILLTLLPLQIAVLVAERAELILQHVCHLADLSVVRVKWPNDVLVNDAKLSGTLIESASTKGNDGNTHETWFLIGIGVNVAHAPRLDTSPGKQIRPAVCLQEYCTDGAELPAHAALVLGTDLAFALADWITTAPPLRDQANRAVLEAWKRRADFGKAYEIRSNNVADESNDSLYQGEVVTAVDIAPDGQLRIQGADGKERLLVADYFF